MIKKLVDVIVHLYDMKSALFQKPPESLKFLSLQDNTKLSSS